MIIKLKNNSKNSIWHASSPETRIAPGQEFEVDLEPGQEIHFNGEDASSLDVSPVSGHEGYEAGKSKSDKGLGFKLI